MGNALDSGCFPLDEDRVMKFSLGILQSNFSADQATTIVEENFLLNGKDGCPITITEEVLLLLLGVKQIPLSAYETERIKGNRYSYYPGIFSLFFYLPSGERREFVSDRVYTGDNNAVSPAILREFGIRFSGDRNQNVEVDSAVLSRPHILRPSVN